MCNLILSLSILNRCVFVLDYLKQLTPEWGLIFYAKNYLTVFRKLKTEPEERNDEKRELYATDVDAMMFESIIQMIVD